MTSSRRPQLDVVRNTQDTPDGRSVWVPEGPTLGPGDSDGDAAAVGGEPKAIKVTRKGEAPFFLSVYADQRYFFGRTSEATVVFGDQTISRAHGQLAYRGDGRWVYRDLGSANGSFLSDFPEYDGPVESARRLQAGRDYDVQVGQSVVLGNRAGRITFLRELPVEERTNPKLRRRSEASDKLERALRLNARHTMPVFLLGPKGSGKTHLARKLHEASGQSGPFVLVNCARLPSDVVALHAELLGSRRGAFTGAYVDRRGALHHAHNGTLFLDEVESLPPAAQNFLLDVLEGTGNFAPLGAPADLEVPRPQFRLVCASKVALDHSPLRPDLRDRIAMGSVILLPTLEERREDIPELVERFCEHLRRERALDVQFDPIALSFLQERPWPGHVRELEGVVKVVAELEAARAVVDQSVPNEPLGSGPRRPTEDHPKLVDAPQRVIISLHAVRELLEARDAAYGRAAAPEQAAAEARQPSGVFRKRAEDLSRQDIVRALGEAGGNRSQAARALGIAYNTFKKRQKEFGVPDDADPNDGA